MPQTDLCSREHESRLRLMIDPAQQTWDLSPNDVAAIRWAQTRIVGLEALLRDLLKWQSTVQELLPDELFDRLRREGIA